MITLNKIQEKIIQAIKSSSLMQKVISQKLNIAQPNISHYVKRDKLPALNTFANLCTVLDLDANEILCIRD